MVSVTSPVVRRSHVLSGRATRILVLSLASLSAASMGLAQTGTSVLGPGTVTTGQCATRTGEPGCVLPNLFGPGGLTLQPIPAFSHYAHYVGAAQETLNRTLSSAIATQLAILPIISP